MTSISLGKIQDLFFHPQGLGIHPERPARVLILRKKSNLTVCWKSSPLASSLTLPQFPQSHWSLPGTFHVYSYSVLPVSLTHKIHSYGSSYTHTILMNWESSWWINLQEHLHCPKHTESTLHADFLYKSQLPPVCISSSVISQGLLLHRPQVCPELAGLGGWKA